MKKMRKEWPLGFLGFFSIYGVAGLMKGEHWMSGIWLLWVLWFAFFIPVKQNNK